MKCTTRALAVQRYGAIDFGLRYWSQKSQWLKTFAVPDAWFPSWHVMDTKMPVHGIACNSDLHEPLLKALTAIHNQGLGSIFENFAGAFNIRMVRGSNTHFSAHSYGLALDINTHSNPLGATSGGLYHHLDFVKCWTDQGFAWGGHFSGRKDPMHFSYCFEG